MKFLGLFIAHASSFFGGKNSNNLIFGGNSVSRQDLNIFKAGASAGSNNAEKINAPYKSVYSEDPAFKDEYIKRLELENKRLTLELCDRQQLIRDLTADFRLIDQGRRSCMIFELYQRLRANLSNDLEKRGILQDGKKLEALLDEVRRGKAFPEDGIIYWMMKFETTPEAQALKKFRNDHAHQTIDDITILRQWRTDLLQDSSPQSRQLNSASISILNKAISHLSSPESRPLQSKYHVETKVAKKDGINGRIWNSKEAKVVTKKLSKRELKIVSKALKKKFRS